MIYVPETIKSALSALALNKVRTFLTMLGVIIGVFSVVALVAVVQGFQNYITDQFESLGSNLILVTPKMSQDHDPGRTFMGNRLSLKNVDTINLYVGDKISVVTPSIRIAKVAEYKSKVTSEEIKDWIQSQLNTIDEKDTGTYINQIIQEITYGRKI